MYGLGMAGLDEFQALTTSIGEYTVDTLGRENLAGLQVWLNPREGSAFMSIALQDSSDIAQRRAIAELFDIERCYSDDVALTYVFVSEISESTDAMAEAPQYSYA